MPSGCGTGRDACIWILDARKLNESQGFEPLIFPLDASSCEPLQQGAFTIHPSRTPIDLIDGAGEYLRKLVTPSVAIPVLFEELTLLGIRKHSLFPDLSALTSELRAIHLPRDL